MGQWPFLAAISLVLVHFSRQQFILSTFAETPTLYLTTVPLAVRQFTGLPYQSTTDWGLQQQPASHSFIALGPDVQKKRVSASCVPISCLFQLLEAPSSLACRCLRFRHQRTKTSCPFTVLPVFSYRDTSGTGLVLILLTSSYTGCICPVLK